MSRSQTLTKPPIAQKQLTQTFKDWVKAQKRPELINACPVLSHLILTSHRYCDNVREHLSLQILAAEGTRNDGQMQKRIMLVRDFLCRTLCARALDAAGFSQCADLLLSAEPVQNGRSLGNLRSVLWTVLPIVRTPPTGDFSQETTVSFDIARDTLLLGVSGLDAKSNDLIDFAVRAATTFGPDCVVEMIDTAIGNQI